MAEATSDIGNDAAIGKLKPFKDGNPVKSINGMGYE